MNHPLDALFDQFLKERRYLKNVTEGTLVWYRVAFSHYTSFVADDHAPLPTKASLQGFVMSLRDRGINPVTCNTYISAMNAFCAWLHAEGYAKDRVKLPKLRVEAGSTRSAAALDTNGWPEREGQHQSPRSRG